MTDNGDSTATPEVSVDERLTELMVLAQAGDGNAYRSLLVEVQILIQKSIKNQLRQYGALSDATSKDIVQETLLAIHNKRHTFEPSRSFLAWMYAIARYKTFDYLRTLKRRNNEVILDDDLTVVETEANAFWEGVGATKDIDTLLKSLSDKQRDVIRLVKLEGLSTTEAAEKLQLSESDIKVTVHRAIKKLRETFEEKSHGKS